MGHLGESMGPLPAAAGCRCLICRPGECDPEDRACIETVIRHGWQVMLVGAGEAPREPEFAYTIGLAHRLDQPELVISGLDGGLMHLALNHVAGRVLNGLRLAPGDYLEGVLGSVPVLVEELGPHGLAETAMWAHRFHRRPVRALQLLWPDTSARFAWQPGASPELGERQPAEWRLAAPKRGLFAPDPVWPMAEPAESRAAACRHVLNGAAVSFAHRERTGFGPDVWVVYCHERHRRADFADSHLSHLVRGAPSIAEVAELQPGAVAWRLHPDDPWQRHSQGRFHPLGQPAWRRRAG